MAVSQLIGAKIHRREDPRLVSGHGRYIDDFTRPGTLHLAIARSPYAHARITAIDPGEAKRAPGVVAVLTAADFEPVIAAGSIPVAPAFVPEKKTVPDRFPLAKTEVVFEGEPVAVVVAEERGQAADAAQLVAVDYEPLPAVGDLDKALQPGSPKAHTDAADNVAWDLTYSADTEASFSQAEVVVKRRILQQRLAPTPMEPRGVLAEYHATDQTMTMWISSQNPHFIRLFIGGALGIPETRFHVISPDVGGGFGCKISPYPEDYLVPATSKLLGRPIKWIETRTESLQTTTHGRGQIFDLELAGKRDGSLLGLRVTQYLDMGAYVGTFGAFQACACLVSNGAYNLQQVGARTVGVLTNRVPTDPYRGAGRPEATHLIERLVSEFSQQIGMDPVEVRRKNFIREFPFTNFAGLAYDSGDYEKSLNRAVELAGYEDLRRRQEEARRQGRYLGIGISTWIELCGFGPSAPQLRPPGASPSRSRRTCACSRPGRSPCTSGPIHTARATTRRSPRSWRRRSASRTSRWSSTTATRTKGHRSATARTARGRWRSAAWPSIAPARRWRTRRRRSRPTCSRRPRTTSCTTAGSSTSRAAPTTANPSARSRSPPTA